MRYIKRVTVAVIIATTLLLNASLNRESTEPEEEGDDVPPDLLALPTYEVPALSDASKVIADIVEENEVEREAVREAKREKARQAERQRIKDAELARIAKEKALEAEKERLAAVKAEEVAEQERLAVVEKERLVALEAEREEVRKAKAPVKASKPTEVRRSNSEQVGAGQSFTATAYVAFCGTGCTGVTASGYDVSNTIYTPDGLRIIAADTSVIPMYSLVQVTLSDGSVFNAQVLDRGGAINGRLIDILVADTAEAQRLGRQDIRVHILRKGR